MAVTYPRGFSAGDVGATYRTWGLQDGDSCHQYIGFVPIYAGQGIVFPNIYQHQQTPFKLADASKEGHQTIVSFFLVDPDVHPVISTSSVAPQQREWIKQAVFDHIDARLPVEVVDQIVEETEGLMDGDEAIACREEMLEVRESFRKANNNYHFCIPFDVWNGPGLST